MPTQKRNLEDLACVVLAKQNSVRVPNKMLRPFGGSNLLDICLKTVSKSQLLKPDQCWLSAAEPDIVSVGEANHWQIWQRGANTLSGGLPLSVYHDFIFKFPHKWILKILATNPLLTADTIDRAITEFLNSDADGLMSVSQEKKVFMKKNGELVQDYSGKPQTFNTQLVEPLYSNASCFYIWDREYMARTDQLFERPLYFEVPARELYDIDEPWQFENAQAIYEARLNTSSVF